MIPSQNVQNADLVELLNGCLHIMEDSNMELVRRRPIPWMLWTICKNRNSLLYAEVQESTLLLAHIALEESTLWNELNKVEQGGNQYLHDLGAPEKWAPPAPGLVKCNMHANWRNDRYLTGGAWITRDHRGEVGMHTRDALLPSPDRLSAEMNCFLWVLRSLRDLRLEEVSVGIDSQRLVEAIQNPIRWPRYRCLLRQIAT